jgi:hypothetical protein
MLNSRSRRLSIVMAAAALPLLGTGNVFAAAPGPGPAGARAASVGAIPAKGLAPLCLATPTAPDCKDGVIS